MAGHRRPLRTPSPLQVVLPLVAPVALLTTEHGRGLLADGFLQLAAVFVPASIALAGVNLAMRLRSPTSTAVRRLARARAILGAAVAFEAARVVSTVWLAVGRGLAVDLLFLADMALALLALSVGVAGIVGGARLSGTGPEGRTDLVAVSALLGAASVPLVPWYLVLRPGLAVVLFNDLTEPDFSAFETSLRAWWVLWLVVAGLGVAGLCAVTLRSRLRIVGVGVGLGAAVAGYVGVWVRASQINAQLAERGVWPVVNVLPLVAVVVCGWGLWRVR